MSKKNSKSVVITIIITLIVLVCLSFAGIRYFNAGDEGTQVKIYEFAVKVFPLLVGIVLIVIASMIATSREETDDEEDKLPPNAYDQQLFEAPADDPADKSASKVVQPEETVEDKVSPEEAEAFYSIFDAPEHIVNTEDEDEPEAEAPAEPQETAVVPQASQAVAATPLMEKPLIDAIYKLVTKLDNVTDYLSYEEEDDDEEDNLDDYEYYDTPQDEEEYEEEPQSHDYSPLENKIDKLCDAIANLTAIVSAQAVAHAAAPSPAPEKPVQKKAEKAAPAPAAPAPAPVIQRVEVPVEVPVDQEINDVDVTDPIQRARIEFDSAKDGEYDISFVYTKANVDNVTASLGESADVFKINGKTVAIIPFLTGAEARDEIDKLGIAYDIQTITADAIANGDFDRDILPRL